MALHYSLGRAPSQLTSQHYSTVKLYPVIPPFILPLCLSP